MKAPDSGGSGEILPITHSLSENTSGVAAASQSPQPPSSSSDIDTIYVPSYSRKSANAEKPSNLF